jgi:hypothetical protein
VLVVIRPESVLIAAVVLDMSLSKVYSFPPLNTLVATVFAASRSAFATTILEVEVTSELVTKKMEETEEISAVSVIRFWKRKLLPTMEPVFRTKFSLAIFCTLMVEKTPLFAVKEDRVGFLLLNTDVSRLFVLICLSVIL